MTGSDGTIYCGDNVHIGGNNNSFSLQNPKGLGYFTQPVKISTHYSCKNNNLLKFGQSFIQKKISEHHKMNSKLVNALFNFVWLEKKKKL